MSIRYLVNISEMMEINALSRLHTVSELPRYNKINRRSDEHTYKFYKSLIFTKENPVCCSNIQTN